MSFYPSVVLEFYGEGASNRSPVPGSTEAPYATAPREDLLFRMDSKKFRHRYCRIADS